MSNTGAGDVTIALGASAVKSVGWRTRSLAPLAPYPTSGVPWECLCAACENVVFPTYDNVRAGTGGCRHCGTYGLGWDEPAIVYLLLHPEHLALKVGVAKLTPARGTTARTELLARRYGWRLYRHLAVPTGREAYRIEQEILRWWRRDLGLPPYLGRTESEGHTETVSLDAINEEAAWQRIVTAAAMGPKRVDRIEVA